MVPEVRIRAVNHAPVHEQRQYVLYWMIAFRRTRWNFSLDRALEWAEDLKKPLLIFEPLRIDYPWASERLHRFVIDGMADNAQHVAAAKNPGVRYFPYVEPKPGASHGLLKALVQQACVVVTDDYPCFFLPRMVAGTAAKLDVRVEMVDSNGLFPLRSTERVFTTALSFRAHLQKQLPPHLEHQPNVNPLKKAKLPRMPRLPAEIMRRWPEASSALLGGKNDELAKMALDHDVKPVAYRGGEVAGRKQLRKFLSRDLARYVLVANQPDDDVRSGLSPYLHFGHLSAHEAFHELTRRQGWSANQLAKPQRGSREGWWNMEPSAEAWLDELVTWRELGFNLTSHTDNYDQYESLPAWAQATLDKHTRDSRAHVYSLEEFATGKTYDPLWNAAQTQLVREGRIHNYLRMLWGKKILEWTQNPREALEVLIELNNRYAIDGRDPNSYSGIFWCLGRYDRAWGPERPIFGKIRYMSSESARRKLKLNAYLEKFGGDE